MKKNLLFCLICLLATSMAFSQERKKVLFIGNSYTHVNDLPSLVSDLAASMEVEIFCESITPGGARFLTHCQNSNVMNALAQGGWDFVVLQGQSQEVAFPDGQFYNEVYPYAKELDSIAKVYNPDVKVLFYMTWGYRYGDQVNCQYYPPFCTFESMSYRLRNNYCLMAEDFSSWVSPVGAAWSNSIERNPELVLHSSDNSHPSIEGSYLAACCFYIMMSSERVHSNFLPSGLSEDNAIFLQEVANSVVYDSLAHWRGEVSSALRDAEVSSEEFFVLNPNPAVDVVNLVFKQAMNDVRVELIDVNARLVDERVVSVKAGEKITLSSHGQKGNFIVIVKCNDKVLKSKVVII